LNGKAFLGVNKLKQVQLRNNVCINQDFTTITAIANLPNSIPKACEYCECDAEACEKLEKAEKQIEILKNGNALQNEIIKSKTSENAQMSNDLMNVNMENNNYKQKIKQLEEKIVLVEQNCF
jgi:hypothetical protein